MHNDSLLSLFSSSFHPFIFQSPVCLYFPPKGHALFSAFCNHTLMCSQTTSTQRDRVMAQKIREAEANHVSLDFIEGRKKSVICPLTNTEMETTLLAT